MSQTASSRASRSRISEARISAVRRFNRFYTREVGLLRKTFLDTPWSLGEMRVLWEIAYGDNPTASDVARNLHLDAAYLSRLLRGFEQQGLVARTKSKTDARQSHLKLTARGKAQFSAADKRQIEVVRQMLARLGKPEQERLVGAMGAIERLLGEPSEEKASYTLRGPRPGDFGWILQRNAEIYAEEYGWVGPFEGVCAKIVSDYLEHHDPEVERTWIAEVDGERVGCIMLVKDDPKARQADVSRIRLLVLEARARGLGIGKRLVDECVKFSREKGYRRITLWTHSELSAARGIYAKAGFVKTGEESHDDWGGKATSEFWDMEL